MYSLCVGSAIGTSAIDVCVCYATLFFTWALAGRAAQAGRLGQFAAARLGPGMIRACAKELPPGWVLLYSPFKIFYNFS